MSTATEGRAPSSPLQLSWREWLDVFKRTGKQFIADDCMGLGQQVAFSSLFAFLGVRAIKKGTPPVPEQALAEAKLTTEALKGNGRH